MIENIWTYSKDGRKPLKKLYESYSELENNGWIKTEIFVQTDKIKKEKIQMPINAFCTPKTGKALWVIAGIHGEEPAGPNAIASKIDVFKKLKKKGIPVVLLPLCNPKGYRKNWRYPEQKRISQNPKLNKSVGSSEHLLFDIENPKKPRTRKPDCPESKAISSFILQAFKKYPPLMVIDHHEDYSIVAPYIYSQGKLGTDDSIAKKIARIIERKMELKKNGKTMFGELIQNGVISGVHDGSIDELLASEKIIVNKKLVKGPSAKSVVVAETQIPNTSLKKRINIHSRIIESLPKFWKMIKKN